MQRFITMVTRSHHWLYTDLSFTYHFLKWIKPLFLSRYNQSIANVWDVITNLFWIFASLEYMNCFKPRSFQLWILLPFNNTGIC
jgi:hypothetical protein